MSEERTLQVEIWSDVVCPWCYIGKRRFERAAEQVEIPVQVIWRSFQLNPSAPAEPEPDLAGALARKYGMGHDEARRMLDQMTRVASDEGLEFDFANAKGGNTLDAHRLIHFARQAAHAGGADAAPAPESAPAPGSTPAPESTPTPDLAPIPHAAGTPDAEDAASAMKERLLRAYFVEGRPIADRETLAELAGEVGLDPAGAAQLLEGEELVEDVRADVQRARELGIRGVPFFLLDGELGISGAQPVEVMVEALRRARSAQAGA